MSLYIFFYFKKSDGYRRVASAGFGLTDNHRFNKNQHQNRCRELPVLAVLSAGDGADLIGTDSEFAQP